MTCRATFHHSAAMSSIPAPPLPAAAQAALYAARPAEYLTYCQRRYGNVFELRTPFVGPVVLIVSPEDVRTLFTGATEEVLAGAANQLLSPLLGPRSVMLLDGAPHLRQRRLLMPPFRGERMLAHEPTIRAVTDQVMAEAPREQPLLLHSYMQRITLQLLLRIVLGAADEQSLHDLGAALGRVLQHQQGLDALWMWKPLQRDLFGLSPWARFRRDLAIADRLLYRQIERCRSQVAQGESQHEDMLSSLLRIRDDSGQTMTDAELRDALMTLLIAGHETTTTMLCWAFDLILCHPNVLSTLQAEIVAATTFGALPYLDAVIKEVLRLRPVIPGPGRRLLQPMKFGNYTVDAGAMVVPATYLTHQHAATYPQPQRFLPERFLNQKPDLYAFYPFGGGVRRCIGMSFALHQMNVVIAQVLLRYRLRKLHAQPARIVLRGFTYAPGSGAEVILHR